MAKQTTYKLAPLDNFLVHALPKPRVVRDSDDEKELEIDALVASGDCFAMLATALDQLTLEPYSSDQELLNQQLEKYVHRLLYLQRFYEIVPKPAEYRQ